jgi:hypothetical protein
MRYPKPLSDLLQEGLAGLGLGARLAEIEIWRLWPEVVGPAIASRSQPLRIINGILTVAVSSGPWMQELSFLKVMMKEKLNDRLGSEIVREIVLKSGRVVSADESIGEEQPHKKPLSARQLALISEQAAAIEDPEIRESFAELMKASLESETCSPQPQNAALHEKNEQP